jgi:hypothetical protein
MHVCSCGELDSDGEEAMRIAVQRGHFQPAAAERVRCAAECASSLTVLMNRRGPRERWANSPLSVVLRASLTIDSSAHWSLHIALPARLTIGMIVRDFPLWSSADFAVFRGRASGWVAVASVLLAASPVVWLRTWRRRSIAGAGAPLIVVLTLLSLLAGAPVPYQVTLAEVAPVRTALAEDAPLERVPLGPALLGPVPLASARLGSLLFLTNHFRESRLNEAGSVAASGEMARSVAGTGEILSQR